MKTETIDLYEYFSFEREGVKAGTLTCFRHGDMTEMRTKKIRPAILVIPGGGYGFVSQREGQPIAMRYFADGFDAFVLNYDIAPVSYPAQIVQAGMAMLYLRREAKNLDIDAEHIAAVGFSAGGHLLGCISLLWDDPALKALFAGGGDATHMPSYGLKDEDFRDGTIDILGVLTASGLASSRSEARRTLCGFTLILQPPSRRLGIRDAKSARQKLQAAPFCRKIK